MRTEEATWLPWLCLKQKALAQVQTWALWRGWGLEDCRAVCPVRTGPCFLHVALRDRAIQGS